MNRQRISSVLLICLISVLIVPATSQTQVLGGFGEETKKLANERDPDGLMRKVTLQLDDADYWMKQTALFVSDATVLDTGLINAIDEAIVSFKNAISALNDVNPPKFEYEQLQQMLVGVVTIEDIQTISKLGVTQWAKNELETAIQKLENFKDGNEEPNSITEVQNTAASLFTTFNRFTIFVL